MAACVIPEELVGQGVLLQYEDPITEEWNTVGGTNDLSLPDRVRGEINSSDNDSDWETFVAAPLKRQEPVTYEFKFRPSQWFRLNALFEDGTTTGWRLVLNNPQQFYYQFCAFPTMLGDAIPRTDLVRSTITLRPTGKPSHGYLNA